MYIVVSLSLSFRARHELNELTLIPPTSVTLVTSVTSGKITNFVEKNAIENVYFSLLTRGAEGDFRRLR